jgi:hypothetical protein
MRAAVTAIMSSRNFSQSSSASATGFVVPVRVSSTSSDGGNGGGGDNKREAPIIKNQLTLTEEGLAGQEQDNE